MKTAKALGLDVPTSILLSADELICARMSASGQLRLRHWAAMSQSRSSFLFRIEL
jgi:hypothetical protein